MWSHVAGCVRPNFVLVFFFYFWFSTPSVHLFSLSPSLESVIIPFRSENTVSSSTLPAPAQLSFGTLTPPILFSALTFIFQPPGNVTQPKPCSFPSWNGSGCWDAASPLHCCALQPSPQGGGGTSAPPRATSNSSHAAGSPEWRPCPVLFPWLLCHGKHHYAEVQSTQCQRPLWRESRRRKNTWEEAAPLPHFCNETLNQNIRGELTNLNATGLSGFRFQLKIFTQPLPQSFILCP